MVLLHGFPFFSQMWAPQRKLSGGRRLIIPDQRGYGDSPLSDGDGSVPSPSLDAVAGDLATLLDHLNLERVVVGGVSMGGYVGLAFARRYPSRVAGLVLAGSRANADSDRERRVRLERAAVVEETRSNDVLLGDFADRLVSAATKTEQPELLQLLRAWIADADPRTVAWTLRAMAARSESFDVLRGLEVPVLVVVGEEDSLNPVAESRAMHDEAKDSELVTLPGIGHMCTMEDPAGFNAAVERFLPRCGP